LRLVVVGLGGIGSILIERLGRFLNYSTQAEHHQLVLIDGDTYEVKNFERQEFSALGPKSEVKANEIKAQYMQLNVESLPMYIDMVNINKVIQEGDVVFVCVDNHKTRNIISTYAKMLKNITIISGGNELTDGNVQVYIRKEGKDITPDLGAYHPEIATPQDKLPTEMSCEELAKSEPQLYFTNLWVATIMCSAFYSAVIKNNLKVSEVYFDLGHMATVSHNRIVKN
jgi:molybdopterin/thiamine biosynthesis adenylyltransferase